MDFSWILLAFFLIAIIGGIAGALSKSMLKNSLRLGAVIVSFLITFILQLCGAFQGIVEGVLTIIDLGALIPELSGAIALINGLASTFVSPIIFIAVFFVILWILRIVIHFVLKAVDKKAAEKATEATETAAEVSEPVAESEPIEKAEETTDAAAVETETADEAEGSVACADGEATVTETIAEESAESAETAPTEEAPTATVEEAATEEAPKKAKKEKQKKQKKPVFYPECAWKRIISVAAGTFSGILLLAVLLMPVFYVSGIGSAITDSVKDSDAKDSSIYKLFEVADEHIISPTSNSFVIKFYDAIGISDLMNFTTRAGGKITLDSGKEIYADDTLKNILTHGFSAVTQMTSLESECNSVKEDIEAIVNDPAVSYIVADLLLGVMDQIEMEEPAEEDLIGGLIINFVDYYKNADRETIENDLKAIGGAAGVLAREKILLQLVGGEGDLGQMLTDGEILGDVVEAISGLSAFAPTVEDAFTLGVDMMGEMLQIPANDSEVYDAFMEDILDGMVKTSNTKYDSQTIQYYVYQVHKQGKTVSSSNGIKGHSTFIAYTKQWAKVQSAFAHASEDKSYGYFTIVIQGNTYVYDSSKSLIVLYDESDPAIVAQYKDRVSPAAGIINALALNAKTTRPTRDDLYAILTAYSASSSADEISREIAGRILLKDGFTSPAVTVEKMVESCDFSAWSDSEVRKNDSRLCVDIIVDLLGLMGTLGGDSSAEGMDAALEYLDLFVMVGETMDVMSKTSCTKGLPDLLIEGLIKSDMLSDFISPDIAFKNIEIVQNNENQTYGNCMAKVAENIRFAISFGGGVLK